MTAVRDLPFILVSFARMKSLLSTATTIRARQCQSACRHGFVRHKARSSGAYALSENTAQKTTAHTLSFEDIGIRAPIAVALHEAFPNVKYPTKCQAEFIPAVMDRKDVLLKDDTGTGKRVSVYIPPGENGGRANARFFHVL